MLAQVAARSGRRAVAEPQAVVVNGQTLTRSQAQLLERAAVLARGSLEERRQGMALVRRVEAELAAALEAGAVEAGIQRVVAALGPDQVVVEQVEVAQFVRDAHGAVQRHQGEPVLRVEAVRRARRIDGLESLLRSGALTLDQHEAGMLYRAAVARAQVPVASSLSERMGAGRSSSDGAVLAALERGLAAVRLRLVRHAVGDDRAMAVLDAVAGRGVTVRSLVAGGDARARATKDLVRALRVAAPLLTLSDEKLRRAIANQGR